MRYTDLHSSIMIVCVEKKVRLSCSIIFKSMGFFISFNNDKILSGRFLFIWYIFNIKDHLCNKQLNIEIRAFVFD